MTQKKSIETQKTEELPDLVPIDDLIENLDFKFFAEHTMRMMSEYQMKERASVLVYLKRYRNSLKRKPRRNKNDTRNSSN